MTDDHIEDHDRGLDHDIPRMISRRRAVGLLAGGLGSAFLAACGGSSGGSESGAASATPAGTAAATGGTASAEIPEETAGPFPGDGSNGPNVLTESGVVRRDITRSFGGAAGVAEGVPTTVELTLLDVAGGGKPLAGAAVYLWHCDMGGRYSLYDQDLSEENYLRGVQESDADGRLAFATIFPAAYQGRWPHMHFEIYESGPARDGVGQRERRDRAGPQRGGLTVRRAGAPRRSAGSGPRRPPPRARGSRCRPPAGSRRPARGRGG